MSPNTLKNIWKAVFVEDKVAGFRDWRLLVQIVSMLIFLWALIPLTRIEKLLKLLKLNPSQKTKNIDPEKLKKYTDAVLNLNFLIFKRNCLRRSLIIYYFLQRAGVPIRIHFGVNKAKGKGISGHGWLTLNGEPYLQSDNVYEGYQEIYSFS